MGQQDLTNYSNVLKEFYIPKIVPLINNRTEGMDLFKKQGTQFDVGGKYAAYPVHHGRNAGTGSIGEKKTLPVAGNQSFAQAQVNYKYTYGRLQITGQVMKASRTNPMAFAQAMETESKNLIKDIARERERQLWGFGVGILCRVNGNQGTNTTINVKDAGGVAGTVGAARYVKVGDNIVFVRNATPSSAADADIVGSSVSATVSSVASDGGSITFDVATGATLNDNDMLVLSPGDLSTESAVNREVMGFLGLVDDGTYVTTLHNVSRSSVAKFNSTVIPVNADWSSKVMQIAESTAYEKFGPIDVIISHVSARDVYLEKLIAFKRFTNDVANKPDLGTMAGAAGKDITWNDHPWKIARMAPYGMIFGIAKEGLKRFVNCEGEFIEDYGQMLIPVSNQDAVEARYRIYDNFQNDQPNSCFRLDGVNVEVQYVQAA